MSRIKKAFENGKAFIAFLTCGDPDLDTTATLIQTIADAGADLIELGIPFSDPTAEGPVIQEANSRALSSGTTTDKIFDMVREVRKKVDIPMVFMTYANVVFSYGTERFIEMASELGIAGLILPDVPFEERHHFLPICKKYGLQLISFVSPTSKERIQKISKEADGFIYCISSLGVTGVRSNISSNVDSTVQLIRKSTQTPIAIGFGISTPEQAIEMSRIADGVIVGSAIVKLIEKYGKHSISYVSDYIKEMKNAIHISNNS